MLRPSEKGLTISAAFKLSGLHVLQHRWMQLQSAHLYSISCHYSQQKALWVQDCAIVPWFVRGYIMEHFRQVHLPPKDCPKVSRLPLVLQDEAPAAL